MKVAENLPLCHSQLSCNSRGHGNAANDQTFKGLRGHTALRDACDACDACDASFKASPGLCSHTPGVVGVFGRLVVGVLLRGFMGAVGGGGDGGGGLVDWGVLSGSHGAVVGVRQLGMLGFGLDN